MTRMCELSIYGRIRQWTGQHPRLASCLRAPKGLVVDLLCYIRRGVRKLTSLPAQAVNVVVFFWQLFWLHRVGAKRIPLQGTPCSSPQIVMLVWAHLPTDPRVEREAKALAAAGFRVKIVCPAWSPPTPAPES